MFEPSPNPEDDEALISEAREVLVEWIEFVANPENSQAIRTNEADEMMEVRHFLQRNQLDDFDFVRQVIQSIPESEALDLVDALLETLTREVENLSSDPEAVLNALDFLDALLISAEPDDVIQRILGSRVTLEASVLLRVQKFWSQLVMALLDDPVSKVTGLNASQRKALLSQYRALFAVAIEAWNHTIQNNEDEEDDDYVEDNEGWVHDFLVNQEVPWSYFRRQQLSEVVAIAYREMVKSQVGKKLINLIEDQQGTQYEPIQAMLVEWIISNYFSDIYAGAYADGFDSEKFKIDEAAQILIGQLGKIYSNTALDSLDVWLFQMTEVMWHINGFVNTMDDQTTFEKTPSLTLGKIKYNFLQLVQMNIVLDSMRPAFDTRVKRLKILLKEVQARQETFNKPLLLPHIPADKRKHRLEEFEAYYTTVGRNLPFTSIQVAVSFFDELFRGNDYIQASTIAEQYSAFSEGGYERASELIARMERLVPPNEMEATLNGVILFASNHYVVENDETMEDTPYHRLAHNLLEILTQNG